MGWIREVYGKSENREDREDRKVLFGITGKEYS